ncbi:MAG: single-stranded DNA-binding protein [Acidobacteriaceae bacterium]
MAGVNKVILLGNLGKDPEVRYTPSGKAVARLAIATSERYKDKEGNTQERTEWHNVTLWDRQAEIAGEYLRKGSQVYIEGRIQTEKYTDKEGIERYATKVIGDRMTLVGSRREDDGGGEGGGNRTGSADRGGRSSGQNGGNRGGATAPASEGDFADFDDDIPF